MVQIKILKTRNPYYGAMKKGEGKYTGRAGDSAGIKDYWNMDIREKVLIQLVDEHDNPIENENFEAEIRRMMKYSSGDQCIEDACKDIGFENLLPGVKSVEDAIKIYNSFPNYGQRIKNHGFIVIEIK